MADSRRVKMGQRDLSSVTTDPQYFSAVLTPFGLSVAVVEDLADGRELLVPPGPDGVGLCSNLSYLVAGKDSFLGLYLTLTANFWTVFPSLAMTLLPSKNIS